MVAGEEDDAVGQASQKGKMLVPDSQALLVVITSSLSLAEFRLSNLGDQYAGKADDAIAFLRTKRKG